MPTRNTVLTDRQENFVRELAASSALAPKAKRELFQKFFVGRDDVYAFRWENHAGKAGYGSLLCWFLSKDKIAY